MTSPIELIVFLLSAALISYLLITIVSNIFETPSEKFHRILKDANKIEIEEEHRFDEVEKLIQEKEQKASELEAKFKSTVIDASRTEIEQSLSSTVRAIHSAIFTVCFHFLPVVGTFALMAGMIYHFTVSKFTIRALFKRSKFVERMVLNQTAKHYKTSLAIQQKGIATINEELRKLRIEKRDYKKNHKPA